MRARLEVLPCEKEEQVWVSDGEDDDERRRTRTRICERPHREMCVFVAEVQGQFRNSTSVQLLPLLYPAMWVSPSTPFVLKTRS